MPWLFLSFYYPIISHLGFNSKTSFFAFLRQSKRSPTILTRQTIQNVSQVPSFSVAGPRFFANLRRKRAISEKRCRRVDNFWGPATVRGLTCNATFHHPRCFSRSATFMASLPFTTYFSHWHHIWRKSTWRRRWNSKSKMLTL